MFGVRVLLAQHLAANLQGLPVQRFGFLVAARRAVQCRQTIEAVGEIRVLLAQHLAAYLQGLPVQRFGFLVAARIVVQYRQRLLRLWAKSGCCSPSTWRRISRACRHSGSASS
jgi:hypothetical protein